MRAAVIAPLVGITAFLLGKASSHVAAVEQPPPIIEPHEETQRLMSELSPAPPPTASEAELLRKLNALIKVAKEDGARFVQQIVLYKVRIDPDNRVPFSDLGPVLFMNVASLPQGHYAEGLSILLYCDNEPIRTYARKLFPMAIGRGCVDGHADLSHFRHLVTGDYQKAEIATPLKRAIFERDPHSAFFLCHQAEHQRIELMEWLRLRRAERTIRIAKLEQEMTNEERQWPALAKTGEPPPPWKPDARTAAAIRELAASKHWWARMFIAEFMVQNKDFCDAEVLKELGKDENELVRQSVASIEKPDPLRMSPVDR